VIWEGPVDNWIKACDYILDLDVDIIVPGHGPIADKLAVREMKAYLAFVKAEARRISLDRFSTWLDPERIIINVASLYREFSGEIAPLDRMPLFAEMKRYRNEHCTHHHAGQAAP
jgi:hypothetical protein